MHDHEVALPPAGPRGAERGRRRRHRRRVPQGPRAPERADPLKLLVAAHDAGGAEIIAAWLRRGRTAQLWLDGPARGVFARRLPELAPLPDAPDPAGFDLVLCGSSGVADHERVLVRAARDAGVRSVVWLDHWVNYAARFDVLPDELWVCDEHAARIARETVPGPPWSCAATPTSRTRRRRCARSRARAGRPSASSTSPSRRPRSQRAPPAIRWAGATTSATRCAGTSSGGRRASCACAGTRPSRRRSTRPLLAEFGVDGERRDDARRGHRVGGHGRRLRHDGDGRRPRRRPARDLGDPAGRAAADAAVRRDRAAIPLTGSPEKRGKRADRADLGPVAEHGVGAFGQRRGGRRSAGERGEQDVRERVRFHAGAGDCASASSSSCGPARPGAHRMSDASSSGRTAST